jgi:integrase/recombinase XerD
VNVGDLVSQYVAIRKALGERCTKEIILRAFCRAIGPKTRVGRIRASAVAAFLAGKGPITRSWHSRYYILKGFFQFAVTRGHLHRLPLPTDIPRCSQPFVPYIYSRSDLRRLLDAIPMYRRRYPGWIEPPTMRAILLLLYGAGLRDGEALRLTVADVDLSNALVTIRRTKFFKSRLVPISRDLSKVLNEYTKWRIAKYPSVGAESPFFVYRNGKAVQLPALQYAFKKLRKYADVRRNDGCRFQPRLHDLRHTFAVHRLTEWYRQGADVQRLVHHLSIYLGHTYLRDTIAYLSMTPEVLQQAGRRFERYAQSEDNRA